MKYKVVLIFLLFTAYSSYSQEIMSLEDCLKEALENNYSLQIVKNENEMAQNNYTKGNAGFLPSVDASARYSGSLRNTASKDFSNVKTETNNLATNTGSANVSASWDIFSGLKAHAKYTQLGDLKEISDLRTRLEAENLIANITSEYYFLVLQTQYKRNLEFMLDISRERIRIVNLNKKLGSGNRYELLKAEVDFNTDSTQLVRQNQRITASKIRIKTLMGLLDFKEDITTDSEIILFPELDYEFLLEKTIAENANILLAAKQINISEQELKIIQSETFPYLRLNSGYSYNYNQYNKGNTKTSFNNGLDYGLTLGVNIFNGGNKRRQIKNAQLSIQNKELAQKETLLDITGKIQELHTSYLNNITLIELEKENFKTAEENFNLAAEYYRLGKLASIDLRIAQNSLQNAEERLLNVQYNAKIDEISLMMFAGNVSVYLNN